MSKEQVNNQKEMPNKDPVWNVDNIKSRPATLEEIEGAKDIKFIPKTMTSLEQILLDSK